MAFHKELDQAVRERAEISALEIRDLDQTVEKEEVVSALSLVAAPARKLRGRN